MKRLPGWVNLVCLTTALVLAAVVEVSLGPVNIPFTKELADAVAYFRGQSSANDVVMGAIRLPRMCVAALVGGTLAATGAALQAIFRNPMADPGIIGVSSGGSLGAVLTIVSGVAMRGIWIPPLAAFASGLLAMWTVYRLGTVGGRTAIHSLLLAGVAVNAICGAIVTLFLSIEPLETMQQMLFWIMGGLDGSSWTSVLILACAAALTLAVLLSQSRALDVLSIGEDQASGVGVNLQGVKRLVLATAALMVGTCVSITGVIGFVGLIVPHLIRIWMGPAHRLLIPASALGGAILVVSADVAARMVLSPTELNIGIVTALMGAPFFLYLLRRQYGVGVRRG